MLGLLPSSFFAVTDLSWADDQWQPHDRFDATTGRATRPLQEFFVTAQQDSMIRVWDTRRPCAPIHAIPSRYSFVTRIEWPLPTSIVVSTDRGELIKYVLEYHM